MIPLTSINSSNVKVFVRPKGIEASSDFEATLNNDGSFVLQKIRISGRFKGRAEFGITVNKIKSQKMIIQVEAGRKHQVTH
jgi:hypothetical protein